MIDPTHFLHAIAMDGMDLGGRDLTASPTLSVGKCWANKLFQAINIVREAIYLSYFTILS